MSLNSSIHCGFTEGNKVSAVDEEPPSSFIITIEELHEYIEDQQWEILREKLFITSSEAFISDIIQADTLLLACQNEAPYDVIKMLVSIKPELLKEKDTEFGHTPLHLMCLNIITQESARGIALLANEYSEATTMPDSYGMTPLHLVCMSPCKSESAVSVIKALCNIGPAALTMENDDDEIPMEVFIMSQTCDSYVAEESQNNAIRLMHKASGIYLLNRQLKIRCEIDRLACCQEAMCISNKDESSSVAA